MTIKIAQIPDVSKYEVATAPDVSKYEVAKLPDVSKYEANKPSYHSSNQTSAYEAIKNMQMGILNFAKTLSSNPVMSMQPAGQQQRPGSKQPDSLGGVDPFGRFLVNQYINNADVVGQQYVNVGLNEPLRSDTSTPNVNLAGVINTIGRIGSPGAGEQKPDGIWQTRTNNALKQIYAVSAALWQFVQDMKMVVRGFTEQDLEAFKNLIPENYTDLSGNIAERAQSIADELAKLLDLYHAAEKAILENPQLKPLIYQEKPFASYTHANPENLTDDEKTLLAGNQDALIPGVNINGKALTLGDLKTLGDFKIFLQEANVDLTQPNALQTNLATVKNALQGTSFGPGF